MFTSPVGPVEVFGTKPFWGFFFTGLGPADHSKRDALNCEGFLGTKPTKHPAFKNKHFIVTSVQKYISKRLQNNDDTNNGLPVK